MPRKKAHDQEKEEYSEKSGRKKKNYGITQTAKERESLERKKDVTLQREGPHLS